MENKRYPVHIVAAGGFVVNSKNQVLMLKSPRYDDWEFPGGQIEESETIPQGLKREIFEETGITVEVKSLIGIYSMKSVCSCNMRIFFPFTIFFYFHLALSVSRSSFVALFHSL